MQEKNTVEQPHLSINLDLGLLPDFCNVKVLFIMVLLTEVLALVLSLAATHNEFFWEYFALSSMLIQWIALLNATSLCYLRSWLNKQNEPLIILYSLIIMLTVSLLVTIALLKLNVILFIDQPAFIAEERTYSFLLRVMTISAAIYAIILRYFYIQKQWRLNIIAQSHSKVQALQARIRPHFLFNSMNTIASLIAVSPDKAETAVEDLSDLFRASLKTDDMSTLNEEIELTKSYLNIEKLRLGERLQTHWNLDNSLKNMQIPSLSLQPIVENAVYHGIEPLVNGGKILLSALKEGKYMVISIQNPLEINTKKSYRKGNQIAQDNIKQRLNLLYNDKAKFIINETKDTYNVVLKIPLSLSE